MRVSGALSGDKPSSPASRTSVPPNLEPSAFQITLPVEARVISASASRLYSAVRVKSASVRRLSSLFSVNAAVKGGEGLIRRQFIARGVGGFERWLWQLKAGNVAAAVSCSWCNTVAVEVIAGNVLAASTARRVGART